MSRPSATTGLIAFAAVVRLVLCAGYAGGCALISYRIVKFKNIRFDSRVVNLEYLIPTPASLSRQLNSAPTLCVYFLSRVE